jgi:hypothetical protein
LRGIQYQGAEKLKVELERLGVFVG